MPGEVCGNRLYRPGGGRQVDPPTPTERVSDNSIFPGGLGDRDGDLAVYLARFFRRSPVAPN